MKLRMAQRWAMEANRDLQSYPDNESIAANARFFSTTAKCFQTFVDVAYIPMLESIAKHHTTNKAEQL